MTQRNENQVTDGSRRRSRARCCRNNMKIQVVVRERQINGTFGAKNEATRPRPEPGKRFGIEACNKGVDKLVKMVENFELFIKNSAPVANNNGAFNDRLTSYSGRLVFFSKLPMRT